GHRQHHASGQRNQRGRLVRRKLRMLLWKELRYLFRQLDRRQAEEELTKEINAHLEIEIQENIEMGMSPEEARYAAMRSFGSAALSMERSRTMWGFNGVENFIQDIKYGARMLFANRVFTAVAVLSLALGIG